MKHRMTGLTMGLLMGAVLVLSGACSSSVVGGDEWTRRDVAAAGQRETMLREVVVVGQRPEMMLDEVTVTAPRPEPAVAEVVVVGRRPVGLSDRRQVSLASGDVTPPGI